MNTDRRTTDRSDIVVGVDGTPESRAALIWAAEEASLRHRPMQLVHAIGNEVAVWLDLEPQDASNVIATATATSDQLLADARACVNHQFPGVSVTEQIPIADASSSLRELSRHAELLVLGNHSTNGHLTGVIDLVEPFLHDDLACPVVLVGHRATPGEGILVVADGTLTSAPTLVYAFSQARRRGQRLTVTLCLADPAPAAVARDLGLVDATARMEAALRASLRGFQRSLLQMQVADLETRFSEVEVSLATDETVTDDLLARAAASMDAVIVDASYARRLRAVTRSSTSADLAAANTVLPTDRASTPELSFEFERQLDPPTRSWSRSDPAIT